MERETKPLQILTSDFVSFAFVTFKYLYWLQIIKNLPTPVTAPIFFLIYFFMFRHFYVVIFCLQFCLSWIKPLLFVLTGDKGHHSHLRSEGLSPSGQLTYVWISSQDFQEPSLMKLPSSSRMLRNIKIRPVACTIKVLRLERQWPVL